MQHGKSVMSLLLATLMVAGTMPLNAETKRDVTDPVLQEILSSFSLRMPRFIDKHGQSVFVADEAITRSGLMFALYEYDKSLKIPKRDAVNRQEFDDLRSRLALIEKKGVQGNASQQYAGQKIDSTQVINDLLPNMPMILDNSLNDSQVFRNLKSEIAARSASATPASFETDRREVQALAQRLDRLERGMADVRTGAGAGSSPATALSPDMKASIVQMQRDIDLLSRRLTPVESSHRDLVALGQRVDKMEQSLPDMRTAHAAPTSSKETVPADMRNAVSQVQKDVDELSRQVGVLESRNGDYATRSQIITMEKRLDAVSDTESRKEIARMSHRLDAIESESGTHQKAPSIEVTRNDLKRLEKRLDDVERTAYVDRPAESGGDARQYASLLTRVTLGLGMVAAFFVAR